MHPNRLQAGFEAYHLPQPPDPAVSLTSFVWLPLAFMPPQLWQAQQWLYQMAFEQARAVARPSLLERDLLAVWN